MWQMHESEESLRMDGKFQTTVRPSVINDVRFGRLSSEQILWMYPRQLKNKDWWSLILNKHQS
jgi:hypothetical protein